MLRLNLADVQVFDLGLLVFAGGKIVFGPFQRTRLPSFCGTTGGTDHRGHHRQTIQSKQLHFMTIQWVRSICENQTIESDMIVPGQQGTDHGLRTIGPRTAEARGTPDEGEEEEMQRPPPRR